MYTDLLTRLQNAQRAKKDIVRVPFSNFDMAVLDILAAHGFVDSKIRKGRMPKRLIEVKLKYEDGEGVIRGVRFVSKSSRRIWVGYRKLAPVRQGYGIGVISTPQGVMTTGEAKKKKTGGEILFEVW